MSEPWILCPICWFPIDIKKGDELKEHVCTNPACLMSSNKIHIRLFTNESDSKKAYEEIQRNQELLLIREVERCTDVWEKPLEYWGFFYCGQKIDRFRILDG